MYRVYARHKVAEVQKNEEDIDLAFEDLIVLDGERRSINK